MSASERGKERRKEMLRISKEIINHIQYLLAMRLTSGVESVAAAVVTLPLLEAAIIAAAAELEPAALDSAAVALLLEAAAAELLVFTVVETFELTAVESLSPAVPFVSMASSIKIR